MTNEQIADALVEYLFTNGAGQRGERLDLAQTDPYAYLGGWSKAAVRGAVITVLAAERPEK